MNQTIKIERVRKGLSSLGRLLFFDGLMKRFNLINKVQPALPSYLAKKQLLPKIAFEFREEMFGRSDKVIITMDATLHEQSGQRLSNSSDLQRLDNK